MDKCWKYSQEYKNQHYDPMRIVKMTPNAKTDVVLENKEV